MFGIKKLTRVVIDLHQAIFTLKTIMYDYDDVQKKENRELHHKLDAQKLELSKINTRFHDLGEKISKSQGNIDILAQSGIKMMNIDDKLIQKLISDDALLVHLKEFVAKQNIIFDYMNDLEKLIGKVELIIEDCLPEKTLKLPKKKKAITETS